MLPTIFAHNRKGEQINCLCSRALTNTYKIPKRAIHCGEVSAFFYAIYRYALDFATIGSADFTSTGERGNGIYGNRAAHQDALPASISCIAERIRRSDRVFGSNLCVFQRHQVVWATPA